jgi:hypothetical protein
MVMSKPKLIIQQEYKGVCSHILVRINDKKQVSYLTKFVNRFIKVKKNQSILNHDFHDIFAFNKEVYFSHRIQEQDINISYLVRDKGKTEKVAFIFLIITYPKDMQSKVEGYKANVFFEL